MEKFKIPYEKACLFSMSDWLNEQTNCGKTFQSLKKNEAFFEEEEHGRIACVLVPESLTAEKKMQEARWQKGQSYRYGLDLYTTNAKQPSLPCFGEEILGESIRRAKRSGERPYWLLLLFLFLVLCAVVSYFGGRFTFFLQRDVNLALCIVIPFAAAFAIHKIHTIRKDLRAYRALWEAEETIEETYARLAVMKELPLLGEQEKESRGKWRKAALTVLCVTLVLAVATLLWHRQGSLSKARFNYFSLQDLESTAVADEIVEDYGNVYRRNGSIMIPRQIETRQSGRITLEAKKDEGEAQDSPAEEGSSGSESVTVAMRTMEYTCLSSSLAHELLIGRMRTQLSWNVLVNGEEVKDEPWAAELDEAYRAGYQSMQYLFLRKGNRVMTIFYLGDANLVENGEKIVDYMIGQ